MARGNQISKQEKQVILDARNIISDVLRSDGNEAETRRRVERLFERLMGYDAFKHLSRERAIHGAGDTEHVDFAIQLEPGLDVAPVMMVELKRVSLDLSGKHLKQASRYAIDAGCEWVLLTNGRDWQLHHVEFGQPPVTRLVEHWDLLHDEPETLVAKFNMISYRSLKRGILDTLWERTKVLAPESLLKAILSTESINALRRVLRRETDVAVSADHIVTGLRKMLNEHAALILDNVEVSLPEPREKKRRKRSVTTSCELADLLQANLIEPGLVLFSDYKGVRYEASVQADGKILLEGKEHKTPSAAGGAVTAKHDVSAPNGWVFWQFLDANGNPKVLQSLREVYMQKQAEEN